MMKNYNLTAKMICLMAAVTVSAPIYALGNNGPVPKIKSFKTAYQGENFTHMIVSSGFNTDVIANGIGPLSASVTGDVDGGGYVFLAKGLQLSATADPITFGLAANGVISNLNSPFTYQLASFTGNNALRLADAGSQGTIEFSNAQSLEKLFLLVTSASASTISGTVTFSDGTSQEIGSYIVPDWFAKSGLPMVATGVGRGRTSDNALDNFGDAPNFFQIEVAIAPANKSKLVSGVKITKNNETKSVFNLLSATGLKVTNAPQNSAFLAVTSGFNFDVIAEGTTNFAASTTNDTDGGKYAFVAAGLQPKETDTPTTYGFAADGVIDNMAEGPNYKLASFSANNTLRLSTGTLEGKVMFNSIKTESVYLLVTSNNGADVDFTLHFADGTTQDANDFKIPGWFDNVNIPLDMVATGIGRVNRETGGLEYFGNAPSLFQVAISVLEANKNKELNGITAKMAESANTFNLLAVSGLETTLGTEGFAMANTKVFPNPVKDILSISGAENISNASVFSLSGQLLKQQNANVSQISFSDLATGVYIVKLTSASGSNKTIKVVKM